MKPLTKIANLQRALRTAFVAALMIVPALALSAPTANSAPTVEGKNAQASDIHTHGKKCGGTKVPRCVWLRVDHANNRVRAYAKIEDAQDGWAYDVKAEHLNFFATPKLIGHSTDYDGWQPTSDGAWTKLVNCQNDRTYTFGIETYFNWRNERTGNVDGEPFGSYDYQFSC